MKYEEIYKNIRDECANLSHKLEDFQNENRLHCDWIAIEQMKKCIIELRNLLHKFQTKIIEDGASIV